ncbi:MAG: hypothetical protein GY721_06350 [Deltaproteobacteria bacterium]|nr:hypothetical protein [Deltaproteobacteria bacterium]
MKTPLFVSVRCPECGGSVRHLEGAYTFECHFCASVLRSETEGVTLKYIIPSRLGRSDILDALQGLPEGGEPTGDREIRHIETVYKPFWYFKGMVYSCHSSGGRNEIDAKTWYYTFQANRTFAPSLRSLGLRSEVLDIEAYDSDLFEEEGVILPVTVEKNEAEREAFDGAERGMGSPATSWKYHKTNIIGEKLFLIYYPIVVVSYGEGDSVQTTLLDGVSAAPLGEGDGGLSGIRDSGVNDEPYHLRIVTHRCGNCGYDLEARDFDIIFYCKNCSRLWLLRGDDYHSLKVRLIKAEDERNVAYIPFWRFEVTVSSDSLGVEMKNIGDFSRLMKMGRHMLRHEDPERPIRFYIPALVTRNAKALIKLAARIGTYQKELPISQGHDLPPQRVWNASLPAEEAEEMVNPLIFMVIGRIDRKAIQFYNDLVITVTDRQLVWYPFEEKGEYLADTFHNYHLPKRSMDVNVY